MPLLPLIRVQIPSNGYHWLVMVKIEENEYSLVVDTGASRTTFDLERVSQLFPEVVIQKTEEKSATVGAVDLDSALAVFPLLHFGNQIFRNTSIALLDLSHVKQVYFQLGLPDVLGVLGADLLTSGKASIDCARDLIRWRKRV